MLTPRIESLIESHKEVAGEIVKIESHKIVISMQCIASDDPRLKAR